MAITFNSYVKSRFDREHVEGIIFDKSSSKLGDAEPLVIDEEDDGLEDPEEEEDIGIEYAIHKENLANWTT